MYISKIYEVRLTQVNVNAWTNNTTICGQMSFILKNSPELLITMKVKLVFCFIIVVFHISFCRGGETSEDDDEENFQATQEWKIVKKGKHVYFLQNIRLHSLHQFVINMWLLQRICK